MAAKPVTLVTPPAPRSSVGWLVIPLLGLGFMAWTHHVRLQRVEYTTGLVAEPLTVDASSPTGYAGGARQLIVPEHNNDSYHWIAQTQQMFAEGEWRVRHVTYDNAPFGRTVESPSPYRWWLGLVAWIDHATSGRPIGQSVEHAALYADPLLHLLLLASASGFVAWQFGCFPAALFSLGVATLYPFAGSFAPGAPDDRSLSILSGIWSLLPLLVGLRTLYANAPSIEANPPDAGRRAQRWFFVAGVTGGLALWVSVSSPTPLLVGIALGGMIAAWAARTTSSVTPADPAGTTAWWTWGLGGAATVLATFVLEYYPDHLASWQLRVTHPLYGLAWLGLAALVVQVGRVAQREKNSWSLRNIIVLALAVAAVAALPVVMWKTKNDGFLAGEVFSLRLSKLPGSAVATSLWSWMLEDGITGKWWATVLPVAVVLPALWLLVRRRASVAARATIAVALGTALVAVGFAGWHLNGWNLAGGLLLALLVACVAATDETHAPGFLRWTWLAAVGTVAFAGVVQLLPQGGSGKDIALTQPELVGLIERDLARWLAGHAGSGGALVLAPPKETTTLMYYNGVRGLGTLAWENVDGIGAAVRIVSASTPEEAKTLIERRGITHLIIPSWDTYLDDYARVGMGQLEGTFLGGVHLWKLPPWLKPVPYQLPTINGFENQSVKILEVVEDQDDAASLSRVAEYFIEMGQLDLAAAVAQALRRFPADLGALVARGQVELARGDTAAFAKTVELLRPRLTGSGDRGLLWDRRASLAVVLARAKLPDLARVQVQRCLADVDEAALRSLTTGSLYRLQVLGKAYGLTIADGQLRELARELLPADLRSRL